MADVGSNIDLNSLSEELDEIYLAYDQYLKGREAALKEGSTAPPELSDYLTPEQLEAPNLTSAAQVSVMYNYTETWASIVEALHFAEALRREIGLANRTKQGYYQTAAERVESDNAYVKKQVAEKKQLIKGRGA